MKKVKFLSVLYLVAHYFYLVALWLRPKTTESEVENVGSWLLQIDEELKKSTLNDS